MNVADRQQRIDKFREFVCHVAHPWTCLSKAERYAVQKLAEVGRCCLRDDAISSIRYHTGPVAKSIFFDAKPLTLRQRNVYKVGDRCFTREGGTPRKLFGVRNFFLFKDALHGWTSK